MNQNLPCFLFSFPVDGLLTQVNQRMLDYLGYESSELIGKLRFEDLLTPGSKIFYKTHFLPMLMMQNKVDEMFLSVSSKGGKEYPVLMNMVLVNSDGRQTIQAVGLHMAKRNKYEKGIIEAKRTAEKALLDNELLLKMKLKLEKQQEVNEQQLRDLRRVNQEQEEFGKILSHDLQEPLRKIHLFAGLLEGRTENEGFDPKLRSYLHKLLDLSEYAQELMARLQRYHSLEDRINESTTGNLSAMIHSALIKLNNPGIAPDLSGLRAVEVYGDIPRLTWVLGELMFNSYKFRSQEEPLSINITADIIKDNFYQVVEDAYKFTHFIQIRIKDNSSGFPPNAEGRVFGLLQKFHPDSGKGIGLAYCKKIVEFHHGHISMKSIPNGGSQFTILLPLNKLDTLD
ncbi:ATP-binding protein [Arenibacter aquaticus]|uniref:ATP-binding protein n=1 Tax=Arenibacter aquaticus TaxID=2489054 RepID=UPI001304DD6D|nr:ATP-binding protein [Arenibacter aquaticus]